MFTVKRLNAASFPRFLPLVPSSLRTALTSGSSAVVALGASAQFEPVGLAIASRSNGSDSGLLWWIYVRSAFRRAGLGAALVRGMEAELARLGCSRVECVYDKFAREAPSIEGLLAVNRWRSPEPWWLMGTGDSRMSAAPWLQWRVTLPPEFTIFPWCDLTGRERRRIVERQQAKPWYPSLLNPFQGEQVLEPRNSLGLRYRDEVVGWIITHAVAPDLVRYARLFVPKEYQRTGCALALMGRALRLHKEKIDPNPHGEFRVHFDSKPMIRFTRRHLAPYLTELVEQWRCSRELHDVAPHANVRPHSLQRAGGPSGLGELARSRISVLS